jgi:hypothetical protein
MGANATTFVPAYVAGEVLTAADLSVTNSGIPVFADSTARDAAFGGTGEKTLAEGQFAYIEATNTTQYYDGAAWVAVGASGLTLVATASPSAVSSISVNNCFSATYQNYLILVNITAIVGSNNAFTMRLRASGTDSTTGYYWQQILAMSGNTTPSASSSLNTSSWNVGELDSTATVFSSHTNVFNPFAADKTFIDLVNQSQLSTGRYDSKLNTGYNSAATSYDGFTLITAGTSFTGTIRVYGFANS